MPLSAVPLNVAQTGSAEPLAIVRVYVRLSLSASAKNRCTVHENC
jgi:hypothetical protein